MQPILVIGCPRSGTSALLELLVRSPELASVHSEGHILWDAYHHPRDRGWDSDALGARRRERARARLHLPGGEDVRWRSVRPRRPASSTRPPRTACASPTWTELFPDARFVFIRRDAPGTVNSLIEAWRARPRFVKYRLPETLDGLGEFSGNRWSFALDPGVARAQGRAAGGDLRAPVHRLQRGGAGRLRGHRSLAPHRGQLRADVLGAAGDSPRAVRPARVGVHLRDRVATPPPWIGTPLPRR